MKEDKILVRRFRMTINEMIFQLQIFMDERRRGIIKFNIPSSFHASCIPASSVFPFPEGRC